MDASGNTARMTSSSPALLAFVVGAGAIALWIDVRFPGLAPATLKRRMIAAGGAFVLLELAPIVGSSAALAYLTLFGALLPAFVAVFVTSAWLLRAAASR